MLNGIFSKLCHIVIFFQNLQNFSCQKIISENDFVWNFLKAKFSWFCWTANNLFSLFPSPFSVPCSVSNPPPPASFTVYWPLFLLLVHLSLTLSALFTSPPPPTNYTKPWAMVLGWGSQRSWIFHWKKETKPGGGGNDYFCCLSLVLGAEEFILQSPGKCQDCETGAEGIHHKNHSSTAVML